MVASRILFVGEEGVIGEGKEDDFLQVAVGVPFTGLIQVRLGRIELGTIFEVFAVRDLHLYDVVAIIFIAADDVYNAGFLGGDFRILCAREESDGFYGSVELGLEGAIEEGAEDVFIFRLTKNALEGDVVLRVQVSYDHKSRTDDWVPRYIFFVSSSRGQVAHLAHLAILS